MEPFPGIAHEDLLKLILSLAALLGAARLLGELMRVFKQPAVVGELLAGVLLGPIFLTLAPEAASSWIVPETATQSQLLDAVAFLGILLLIVVVGLETDISLIRTRIRTATSVGLGGLFLPFAAGFALGWVFPGDLVGAGVPRIVFSLFLAVALALSAIPVLAKVLADLSLLKSRFGQTALAAGMIDDLLGWTLLGVVTALGASGTVTIGTLASTIGAVILFFLATWFVARPVARASLRIVQDRFKLRDRILSLVVFLALAWGAFSHALHLEPILGAFAIGVIFGQSRRLPLDVVRRLESVTYGIFAPLFLATAGLRLRLEVLTNARLLWITVALVGTAATAKLVGCYLGARFGARTSSREALAFGVALNARGVLGIVVASVGLSMGFFGVEVYSMVVVASVVTSIATPIGLRWLLRDEIDSRSAAVSELESVRRVLVPVRQRAEVTHGHRRLETAVLATLNLHEPAVTLMTVVERSERKSANGYLADVAELFPPGTDLNRRVVSGDPVSAIVEESRHGYDLVILGAPEPAGSDDHVFEPTVDEIIKMLPCPSLVLAAREGQWPPRSILVPTSGSSTAVRVVDLAYALSGPATRVILFHVVDDESATQMATGRHSSTSVRFGVAQAIVDDLRSRAGNQADSVVGEVAMGSSTTSAILERATDEVDLIVMGANVHAGSHRLYLGPKIERILRDAPCSVILYNV